MYECNLIEVPNVQEFLNELNQMGAKIVSVTYVSDSQQVLIIYKINVEPVDVRWLNNG